MRIRLLLGSILSLLLGGLIYVFFRPHSLLMFEWFEAIGLDKIFRNIRKSSLPLINLLPDWVLNSLPDGLWIFSSVCLVLAVWQNSLSQKNIVWVLLLPIIAIASEIGQLLGFVIGTFDVLDLVFYIIGLLLPFKFYKTTITFKIN